MRNIAVVSLSVLNSGLRQTGNVTAMNIATSEPIFDACSDVNPDVMAAIDDAGDASDENSRLRHAGARIASTAVYISTLFRIFENRVQVDDYNNLTNLPYIKRTVSVPSPEYKDQISAGIALNNLPTYGISARIWTQGDASEYTHSGLSIAARPVESSS